MTIGKTLWLSHAALLKLVNSLQFYFMDGLQIKDGFLSLIFPGSPAQASSLFQD
jgi:hypothetical protein